jgi:FixJ family two-component response regulator
MAESISTIYVIDDDASVRDAVSSLLRSVGLHAEVFGSTLEFLNAKRPEAPSCLVLDVRLPGVSGLEFQDQLTKAGIGIPIIFVTAHGDIPMTSRAMKAGAVDFLPKPFQKQDLLAAIHLALDRDRARREDPAKVSEDLGLGLLNKVASRMSAATPLQEVLAEVVEFVASVVECDSCFAYLLENDELVLRASKNPHPELVDRLKLKLGQGITGWVAEHREPVAVTRSAFEDPRFKLFNELPEDRFEAFLSVPIISGGRLVGVINVQDRAEHQYSPREIGLIATVGFLVGAEVERARLESENLELSNRLETRKVVERAKGILQRELKISEGDAYRMMQRQSQQRRKSMREISEAIILGDDLRRGSTVKT